VTKQSARLFVELPIPEAAHLAMLAAGEGVSVPEYLGYLVLKAVYAYKSPIVVAFETRPKSGPERKT
jgi:hypothetical protein